MLPTTAPPPPRVLQFTSPVHRWLLLLPVGLVIAGAFFTLRWTAGDTIARSAGNRELAEFAVRLAPSDPQTHFALGKLAEASLEPGAQDLAVREYETALRLAPEDYRLWMILAAALERNGDTAKAEIAYLEAERLAPAYAMPQWAAGNFLLRTGRTETGMYRLLNAGESMERLRRPVLDLLLGYYGDGGGELLSPNSRRTELRRALLQLLLDRNSPAEAGRVWMGMTPNERAAASPLGARLVAELVADKRFTSALILQNELVPGRDLKVEQVDNPTFEGDVATDGANLFGWQLSPGGQPQIALDSGQGHGRSLLLVFSRSDNVQLRGVTQLVVADALRRYRLTYQVRSSELSGAAGVRVQILDAVDQTVLAQSEPLPPGTTEWRAESLDFSVPDRSEGVIIRLGAVTCTADACPVFGRVWYDEFELKRND